jgi:ATP synthase protein I
LDGSGSYGKRAKSEFKSNVSTIKAPPIYKVIASQFIAVGLITIVCYVTLGWISAYSLLLGGLICAIPNAYFASKAFRYRGARATELIVKEMYKGEVVKLLLMSTGFGLSFLFVRPLDAAALFAGFVLVYVVGMLVFVRISRTGAKNC